MGGVSRESVAAAARARPEPRARSQRRLAINPPRCRLRARRRPHAADRPGAGRRTDLLALRCRRFGATCRGKSPWPSCASRGPATRSSVASSIRMLPRPARLDASAWRNPRGTRARSACAISSSSIAAGLPARAALDALARIAHPSTARLLAAERLSKNDVHRRYGYEGLARLGGVPARRRGGVREAADRGTQSRGDRCDDLRAGCRAAGPTSIASSQALANRRHSRPGARYLVELGHASSRTASAAPAACRPGCSRAGGHGRRVHGWRWRRGCAHAVDPRPGSGGASGGAGGDHAVASRQPASGARLRSSGGG